MCTYSTRQGHNVPKSKDDEGLVQKNAGYFFITTFYYLIHVFIIAPFFLAFCIYFHTILTFSGILVKNIGTTFCIGFVCVCVCSQDKNLGQYVPKSHDSEGLVQKMAYKDLYVILKVIFYCKLL